MTATGRTDRRVWDPLVRVTHWVIALAVLLNYAIVDEESVVHVWVGYTALAMLGLRVIWGFVGTEPARFSSFPPDPSAALAHLREMFSRPRQAHSSHNPLGALMVYALWATLFTVGGTGMVLDVVGEHGLLGEAAEEIHEVAATLLVVLAAFHVGGVVLESRLTGTNLVRRMTWHPRGRPGDG
ncbi:cytochrome b/b6 domain-containing protein [Nisaea acidiphila]|uniref:Cytochrome b/b6 domain-containing protein n=1 Tax=Nisaea acidiphila TaxID=1862145 RepID=A0A9J7AP62_9PROT|nr:cytochrome b/b6 domain-containing protein [Nisaea acidiphila]UUX48706.1 cytochrome b/b6 domain-containing protein [Nisaea acidiphila]